MFISITLKSNDFSINTRVDNKQTIRNMLKILKSHSLILQNPDEINFVKAKLANKVITSDCSFLSENIRSGEIISIINEVPL